VQQRVSPIDPVSVNERLRKTPRLAQLPPYDLLNARVCPFYNSIDIGFDHEPSQLAVSSAEASLTNSSSHAMRAASAAHKPSLTKSPEEVKSSPTHALRAASAADRDSSLQKSPSPPSSRLSDEAARINQLAQQLAQEEFDASGGVSRSDLTRAASISMARKQANDKAEQDAIVQRKKLVEQEAKEEWSHHQEVEDAARRIVAERLARVTLTGEEGDERLAGKAAGDAIHRGDKRVKDWERVLKELELENKQDQDKKTGWLRHSMRHSAIEPSRQDPEQVIEYAKRNVKSQLGEMDRSIAHEQLLLGKLPEQTAQREELEEKGAADLEKAQKQRASMSFLKLSNAGTYDIGGILMTHEQVEAIAQKHVNEVLAEINEKVEREKERLAKIAEEKRAKEEARAAEKKRKADEKAAQKEWKAVAKEQLAVGEGLAQYDAQKDKEAELAARRDNLIKERALNQVEHELADAVGGVMDYDDIREKRAEYARQVDEKEKQQTLDKTQKELAGAVTGVMEHDYIQDKRAEYAHQVDEKEKEQVLDSAQKDLGSAVGGVMEFDDQKAKEAAYERKVEELHTRRELDNAQKEQAAAVGGILELDAQKDKEAAFQNQVEKLHMNQELDTAQKEQAGAIGGVIAYEAQQDEKAALKHRIEDAQKDTALKAAQGEQASAVDGVLQYDKEKDTEAARKEAVEKYKANVDLQKATAEQAHAAEVVLHPDTALEDDSKRQTLKSWFKDKKDKVAKRLSMSKENYIEPIATPSPTSSPTKSDIKKVDNEDIYGSQPLKSTNWTAVDLPRDDSVKEVALAKADQSTEHPSTESTKKSAKPPVQEITDISAYKNPEYNPNASEDEHYDDAAEDFEEEPAPTSSLAVKEEAGKVSSERGSRFKEEF
jgi:colicin import membrane protein